MPFYTRMNVLLNVTPKSEESKVDFELSQPLNLVFMK